MLGKKITEALGTLTEREEACLLCYGEGMTKAEIGEELCISENTVKTHLKTALLKLSAKNATQAAVWVALAGAAA